MSTIEGDESHAALRERIAALEKEKEILASVREWLKQGASIRATDPTRFLEVGPDGIVYGGLTITMEPDKERDALRDDLRAVREEYAALHAKYIATEMGREAGWNEAARIREDLRAVVEAARSVTWFEYVDDDDDVKDAVQALRNALARPGVRALSPEPPQDVS